MTKLSTEPHAFKTFGAAASSFVDAMITAQETCINAIEQTAETMKDPTNKLNGHTELPFFMQGLSEDRMREAFHQLANANLRGWEQTANFWQSAPDWARLPITAPGSVMTEWFDKMRRTTPTATAAPIVESAPTPVVEADDLTAIKGVGPKMSATLGEAGIETFDQIASWTAAEAKDLEAELGIRAGRISKEKWVSQAKKLAKKAA